MKSSYMRTFQLKKCVLFCCTISLLIVIASTSRAEVELTIPADLVFYEGNGLRSVDILAVSDSASDQLTSLGLVRN
jgi:hypothetical protein